MDNTTNNNIALVNILLTKFAKEAQNLVATAQKIYDGNNNIVFSQVDKFNEQWGVLKGHCSTVGLAINGFKESRPEPYIQKIEIIVAEINKKKMEVGSTPVTANDHNGDGKTPRSGIGDEGLSTLPLIIINLLSTVKMAVEDYNEQVLGACVNTSSPMNDNDPEGSLNVSTFVVNNESTSSLDSEPNLSGNVLNKSNSSFNQSSSTLSCLSNSALQALEAENVLSSKSSSKSSLSNEILPLNDNANSNATGTPGGNNNNMVTINHPNANGLSYTPKPLPFGFEEEKKESRSREGSLSKDNPDSRIRDREGSVERRRGPPPEDRRMAPRPPNGVRKNSNPGTNIIPNPRKDSMDDMRGRDMDDRRRYDREKSCERRRMEGGGGNEDPRRGREMDDRRRYDREKSCERRRMEGGEGGEDPRRGRDKSRDRRRMDSNEGRMRGASEDPYRGRDKSRDRRRMDGNESFSVRDKSCDRRRMDGNESFSVRDKSCDRRRMEGSRSGSVDDRRRYDREKSCERRRMEENDRRDGGGSGHEREASTASNSEQRKNSRSSINLDNYQRKDSLDNPGVRKEKSLNNIKLKDELKQSPNLRKNCSMEDVRNRKPPMKVNVDIYPKRLDSHEKPPMLKGDRSVIIDSTGSTGNSPFIGNCKSSQMRTPSMDNIPSAVSVDTGTAPKRPNIMGRQRNISNPVQGSNNSKTPKIVNYDPASRTPKKLPSNSNYEQQSVKTPYSSNLEYARTPLFSEPDNIHSAVTPHERNNSSQGITRKRSVSASYAQNPLFSNSPSNSPRIINKASPLRPGPGSLGPGIDRPYHYRQESDPTLSHHSVLKPNKSSPAIRSMANNFNNQDGGGIKKQIDNIYNELSSMNRSQHHRNISSSSINDHSPLGRDNFSPHFSFASKPTLQSRRSNISTTSSGTEATERLSTNVQFINNFDKSVRMNEGMDRRSYLYEDYFTRNSEGELIDLQMVLVPLNNMFEICTLDLNEPIRFGRSNVNNVENFMTFRSLVISRTHAEIWSEDDKVRI